MKKFYASFLLTAGLMIGGCTMPMGPCMAPIMLDQKGPVAGFNTNAGSRSVGRARAEGIILIGTGDASIAAAAAAANITNIHHVDSESMNVLGIYSRYETIVYGD